MLTSLNSRILFHTNINTITHGAFNKGLLTQQVSLPGIRPSVRLLHHNKMSSPTFAANKLFSRIDTTLDKKIPLNLTSLASATELLKSNGKMIVVPTKVGYILMTSDRAGLLKKYDAKQRKLEKPSVVLCHSLEQLEQLAQTTPAIMNFYQRHWQQDILMGCILPWKPSAHEKYLQSNQCEDLVSDPQKTSCFVVKFGSPGEHISKNMWESQSRLVFASSANPSGKGNKGKIENIGTRIESKSDLIISSNEFVDSYQPDKNENERYHQGAMISFVNDQGKLIDTDHEPVILIREGLDLQQITHNLDECFPHWQNLHGQYY